MKMKVVSLLAAILVLVLYTQPTQAQWVQKGMDIDGESNLDLSGFSVCMPDAFTLAIGANRNDGRGLDAGHVRIFRWTGSTWVQKGSDIDGEAAGDLSGFALSMPDSNTIAVGAPNNDGNGSNSGHVRIYQWNGTTWNQKGMDIDGEAIDDQFGRSISMPNPNIVAIGTPYNGGNGYWSGHVRIYLWNGLSWTQLGNDIDGEASNDNSGVVSMPDANTVAIGASENDGNGSNSGHVRVYAWNSTSWVQKGSDIDGEAINDLSGWSVSMPDANTLAIGANWNDGNGPVAGHVRIYSWNGINWVQKGQDIDGEAALDEFGWAVDMPDANHIAISSTQNDGSGPLAGHVRLFRWNGSSWVQKGLDIDGEFANDNSGFGISMPDTSTVAIGAPFNDGNGSSSGHVRVYRFGNITSINEIENTTDEHFFYPNPSNGIITIEQKEYSNYPLQIFDLSGKLIQEFQLNESRNNLDLRTLAEGIYFVRYGSETKKLVIAK